MNIINKIGLGTVQFGVNYGISNKQGKVSFENVGDILDLSKKLQISVIDSASGYGDAERILGRYDLTHFKLISKFIISKGTPPISRQLEDTLTDLNLDSIYGYLAHRPNDILENPEVWAELEQLKQSNKVEKIGFSLNTPTELASLLQNNICPDIVQVPFNYFDWRFAAIIEELKTAGCEVHARSAFLQGLFFADVGSLSNFFNPVKTVIAKLQIEHKELLPGVLLKHVISRDFIDRVIVGVQTRDQLSQNLGGILHAPDLEPFSGDIPEEILTPFAWPKNNK